MSAHNTQENRHVNHVPATLIPQDMKTELLAAQRRLNSLHRFHSLPEFVFPNPHDAPAVTAERASDKLVAVLVGGQFLFPECAVACRHGGVFRTGVPETAVHKDGDSLLRKDEVRTDGDS